MPTEKQINFINELKDHIFSIGGYLEHNRNEEQIKNMTVKQASAFISYLIYEKDNLISSRVNEGVQYGG